MNEDQVKLMINISLFLQLQIMMLSVASDNFSSIFSTLKDLKSASSCGEYDIIPVKGPYVLLLTSVMEICRPFGTNQERVADKASGSQFMNLSL